MQENINNCSIFKGHLDIVDLLLDRGAKVQLRNSKGETALSHIRVHLRDGRRGVDESYKR